LTRKFEVKILKFVRECNAALVRAVHVRLRRERERGSGLGYVQEIAVSLLWIYFACNSFASCPLEQPVSWPIYTWKPVLAFTKRRLIAWPAICCSGCINVTYLTQKKTLIFNCKLLLETLKLILLHESNVQNARIVSLW